MFPALEGLPRTGTRCSLSLTLSAASVLRPPPYCSSSSCASLFTAGTFSPRRQLLRTEALFSKTLGLHWPWSPSLSGSQTVAWYCSLRSGAEVGQRMGVHGQRTQG